MYWAVCLSALFMLPAAGEENLGATAKGTCPLPPAVPWEKAGGAIQHECETGGGSELEQLLPVRYARLPSSNPWVGIVRVVSGSGSRIGWLAMTEAKDGSLNGTLVFVERGHRVAEDGRQSGPKGIGWNGTCYGGDEFDLSAARALFPWLERHAIALTPGPEGMFLDAPSLDVVSATDNGLLLFSAIDPADEVASSLFGRLCDLLGDSWNEEPVCRALFGARAQSEGCAGGNVAPGRPGGGHESRAVPVTRGSSGVSHPQRSMPPSGGGGGDVLERAQQ